MDDTDIRTGLAHPEVLFNQELLDMTFAQKAALSQNVIESFTFSQTRIADIRTAEQLRRRIAEFIHWNTLCTVPTTGARVNRIFGRVAQRYDTSTSYIVDLFIKSGRIMQFPRGRQAYVSTAVWNEVEGIWRDNGLDQIEIGELLDRWALNTM